MRMVNADGDECENDVMMLMRMVNADGDDGDDGDHPSLSFSPS